MFYFRFAASLDITKTFWSPQSMTFLSYSQSAPESFRDSSDFDENKFSEYKEEQKDELSADEHDVFDEDEDIIIVGEEPFLEYDFEPLDVESESEFADEPEEDQKSQGPLFLQLTCSLRGRNSKGTFIENVSVNTLPICLGRLSGQCRWPCPTDEGFIFISLSRLWIYLAWV